MEPAKEVEVGGRGENRRGTATDGASDEFLGSGEETPAGGSRDVAGELGYPGPASDHELVTAWEWFRF